MQTTDNGESSTSRYIPYFDKAAMFQLDAQENGERAYQLLLASKSQASACLDSIVSIRSIPKETIELIALQLLEKGWHVRIFSWLERVLHETPEYLSDCLIRITSSEYWRTIPDAASNEKLERKRILFSQRFESFFEDALRKFQRDERGEPRMQRAYGLYLRNILRNDAKALKSLGKAIEIDRDPGAIVPFAQILIDKNQANAAKLILSLGWKKFHDIESLRALTQLEFMMKNSKEAIPLFTYLKQMGEPLEGELAEHLRDYQFPRDFHAIEQLGVSGKDHYLIEEHKKDLFKAIRLGLNSFEKGSLESREYELRSLRMSAIELRNYHDAQKFITLMIQYYESGWEKRQFLKDFFENHPLPRALAFLKSENQGAYNGVFETGENLDTGSFEDIFCAHLYLAARFALTPDRVETLRLLRDFSEEHELELLKPLIHDLLLLQERIEKISTLLGGDFSDVYQHMQGLTTKVIQGEENYYAILNMLLEGSCKLESPIFRDQGCLVALTMSAVLYGADIEFTESMIEMIQIDHLPPLVAKQFGRLLQNCGYERYALSVYAQADLRDMEVLSPMLHLGFSENYFPHHVITALTTRIDFNPDTPIDLKVIIADALRNNMLSDGTYPSELLAMFGEISIAYGHIRDGLTILRDAAKSGNLRAKMRIAEYYLYQISRPKKALELFQELYSTTKDPKYLADIARARKGLMEIASEKNPEAPQFDVEELLESIKALGEDHPDYLSAFLELSVWGSDEVFQKGCRALIYSRPKKIDTLPDHIFGLYDIRLIEEIDKIEKKARVEWSDITNHLFYSRILACIHLDKIEFTFDYLDDLLKYMTDFQIQAVGREKYSQEDMEAKRVSVRNTFFGKFLQQFSEAGFVVESEEFIYSLMDYDDEGNEVGVLDQIVDPFVIALILEIHFFEQAHMGSKKMPQFCEYVAEIFETVCNHPILAKIYDQKAQNIREYFKNAKKPKFVDVAVQNSPTLLQ